MSRQPTSTEAMIEKARACLAAYGADVARWPAADRAACGEYLMSDALAEDRAEAATLDDLLGAATGPATPSRLQHDIMAAWRTAAAAAPAAQASGGGWFSRLFGRIGPAPAGVFASMAIIGFAIGVIGAGENGVAPEYEAIAYLDASAMADLTVTEGGLWDEE